MGAGSPSPGGISGHAPDPCLNKIPRVTRIRPRFGEPRPGRQGSWGRAAPSCGLRGPGVGAGAAGPSRGFSRPEAEAGMKVSCHPLFDSCSEAP